MSHALLRVLLLVLVALPLVPEPGPAGAQTSRLGIVTTLVGDATIARPAGTPRAVTFKDAVFPGDTIRTAGGGLVRVLLRGSTLVAIGDTSAVGLGTEAGRSTVRLEAGTVSVVVGGDRPVPLDIVTPQATASLRGTSVIARMTAGGPVRFYVLAGAVSLAPRGTPPTPGAGGVHLKALESATVTDGKVGPVVALTRETAETLMKDFRLVPAHPDAPAEAVKALGARGASEVEKEAKALRDQGVKGLPRTDDPSRRPVVPIQPDVRPTQAPRGCC
jgi:ferric-dicitrate binding protein FerR (iron transport regulator)